MNKYVRILLLSIIVTQALQICIPAQCVAIDISAVSGILMDRDTYRVLYEKNARVKMGMASTTKIMTGLLAIERGNLEDVVKTSQWAANVEGSSIWLEPGEPQTLEDLVYGLLLSSGNDAAIAIAEHVGGSYENFIKLMNKKALEIGAVNTKFENPHGLDGDNHYTTAFDLALLTSFALKNDKFAQIVKTKKRKIPWQGHEWNRVLNNHNKLLDMYDGCDGVKTGFTKRSGRCLVSSATKEGWQAVAVTLNAPNDWEDHKSMLNYAYDNYNQKVIIKKDNHMKTLPVIEGRKERVAIIANNDFKLTLKSGEEEKIETIYQIPNLLTAPVTFGQKIGEVSILLDGLVCGSVDLLANDYVERRDYNLSLIKIIKNWMRIFSYL